MEPGLYEGIPEDEYHRSAGVSVSTLKRFAEAPAKALVRRPETKSLAIGSLVHMALLQPHLLEQTYYVTDLDRISDREKATKDEREKAQGRELVKRKDWDAAMRLRDAVMRHPTVRDLIVPEHLILETSMYWTDPVTGLLCRGRADVIRMDWRVLIDIKSTEDASREGFAKSVGNYRYHWQDWFYRWGLGHAAGWRPESFVFISVEKEEPYLVGCYELTPQTLEKAEREVRDMLDAYAECTRTGIWPGYSEALEPLDLPHWYRPPAPPVLPVPAAMEAVS